jgi:hypothetical protein
MFISCVLMGKAHWRGPFPICGAAVSYCLGPIILRMPLPYPTLGLCLTQKLGKTKQVLLHVSDQIAGCCGFHGSFIIYKPMVHSPCVCLHLLQHALVLFVDGFPSLFIYIYRVPIIVVEMNTGLQVPNEKHPESKTKHVGRYFKFQSLRVSSKYWPQYHPCA